MREISEEEIQALHEHFLKEGRKAGANAAEWEAMNLWGGRCTDQKQGLKAAWSVLDGIAILNPPNLSGEWSGSPTPTTILQEAMEILDLEEDDLDRDLILYETIECNSVDSWEEGALTGFQEEIERQANLRIMEEDRS